MVGRRLKPGHIVLTFQVGKVSWLDHIVLLLLLLLFSLYFVLFSKWKKEKKNQKNIKIVCVCIYWYLCTLDSHWNKVSKCISCNLDGHLNAQLSKWNLWLVFVMSKIKLSLISHTHITLFDGKDRKILRICIYSWLYVFLYPAIWLHILILDVWLNLQHILVRILWSASNFD